MKLKILIFYVSIFLQNRHELSGQPPILQVEKINTSDEHPQRNCYLYLKKFLNQIFSHLLNINFTILKKHKFYELKFA